MTDLTQLIDYDGAFLPSVEDWIKKEGFQTKGFDYSVVTVLGCQSSGKSTLLNELFGTTFEVMDASRGRKQTTKGLWLGRDKSDSTLIIDVEGTDSKERGEDRLTFEHRAALFSLALADIVIVNMWYHDLGRYTASNYGLLKTVLGVNLELFQQQESPKTIMLFIIRDYDDAQTPLATLNKMIQSDIRNIWKEITKPEHLRDSTADDFFTFKTIGLPSKFAKPSEFVNQCKDLRSMWFNEIRPHSYSRQIPSDGFGMYCKSVWETILKSSELDIPSQKEMLATYRCEELKNEALSEILPSLATYLVQAQKGTLPMDNFSWAAALVVKALDLYDKNASRYQQSIFLKKREQLLQCCQTELQKVIDAHLTHVRHRIATEASTGLDLLFSSSYGNADIIGGLPKLQCWSRFAETSDRWRDEAMKKFDKMASSFTFAYTVDGSPCKADASTQLMEFDSTHARQALFESLDAILLRMREKQQNELRKVIEEVAAAQLGDLDVYLEKNPTYQGFWTSINELIVSSKKELMDSLGEAWFGLQPSREAHLELWDVYSSKAVLQQMRIKLERICEWLQNHIINRFQQFFDLDEQGVPRQWQHLSNDTIKQIYIQARTNGLVVLQIFDSVGISIDLLIKDQPAFEKQIMSPLISEAKKQQILSRANRQMRKACQEAQLIQASGGLGINIPWWMWGLLLAFGYNEIVMIIFSPFAWILIAIGFFIWLITYYTGNMLLPIQLSRHLAGITASTIMVFMRSFQQPLPAEAPPVQPKTEVKEEE